MAITIKYNGATIASLNPGQKATLKCAEERMATDLVVEDESIGDIDVNGVLEYYRVNAGAKVSAGDFVEFVSKTGSNMLTSNRADSFKACRLDDSRVLVVYGAQNRGNAAVLCFDSTEATIEQTGAFDPLGATTIYSVGAISSRQAFVTYTWDGRLRCIVLNINGAEITAGEYYEISGASYSLTSCSAAVLAGGKAIVTYSGRSSGAVNTYLYAELFAVEDDKIVKLNTATVRSANNSLDYFYGKVVALSGNTALLTYTFADDRSTGGTRYSDYARCAIITDDVISLGVEANSIVTAYTFKDHALVPLTGSKAVAVAPKDSFGDGRLYVLTVNENGTVSVGRSTTFTAAQGAVSATALSPESVLVVYKDTAGTGSAVIVNVDENNDVTRSDPAVYYTAELKNHEVLALSSASAIVLHTNTGGTGLIYTGLNIEGDALTQEGAGTCVQPATSRLHGVGIARTAGEAGELVAVYHVE